MRKFLSTVLAVAAVTGVSSSAMAAVIVTVSEYGVVIASWQQSQAPVLTSGQYQLNNYADVPVYNFVGAGTTNNIYWYASSNNGGGLSNYSTNLNIVGGPLFTMPGAFSGTTAAPVFRIGTYYGTDVGNTGLQSTPATVTISVPEPATWAMMLVGLGMVGFAARRRKVTVTYA